MALRGSFTSLVRMLGSNSSRHSLLWSKSFSVASPLAATYSSGQQNINQPLTLRQAIPTPIRRQFCSQADDNAKSMAQFLEEEIQAETDLARKNMDGRDAPTIPGFTIEKTDDAEVVLTKQHGSEKITVKLNVNHSVDPEQRMEQDREEEEEDGPSLASHPSFTVEIEKGQQKLAFECQIPDVEEMETGNCGACEVDEIYMYSGEMTEKVYCTSGTVLDQQMCDHIGRYLKERGIDHNFVPQLIQFATHYEHAQYVAFLRKMKDFVASG